MADKKKAGVSVVPEFVAGEQPTADKFNAISVQLERASSELEKSVGDVWGESWPYSTSSTTKLTLPYGRNLTNDGKVNNAYDSFLDIANIARLIGPAANLNPTFPEFFDGEADPIYSVEDEVLQSTSATEERREFWLRFPPDLSSSIPVPGGTAGASLTRRTLTHDLVRASGDWCVTEDRKFTTFDPVSAGQSLTVTYETIPQSWGTGPDVPGSTYNVIPDPNQTANDTGISAQCTATVAGDGYTVQLPTASHTRINDNGTNTQLNGDGDIAEAAQLSLPRVLRDNFIAGDVIPEGFVYLRDNVTGKLYSDAVYRYNDSNTLKVENVELDITHGFSVITIGSTITEAIHDLRYKWFHHSHDGTYGEAPIHVSSLAGILESEGDTGIYVTSQIANNWMPQYLHRDGYRVDSDANDNNAMRGDLVLGSDHFEGFPGAYLSDSFGSYGLYFGSRSLDAPYIKKYGVAPTTWVNFHNPEGATSIQAKRNLSLRSEEGDVTARGGVYLSSGGGGSPEDYIDTSLTLYENVGLGSQDNVGNVDLRNSSVITDGIAAGPRVGDYSVGVAWSINHDGVGTSSTVRRYATWPLSTVTDDAWKAPVIQVLHLAVQNYEFLCRSSNGGTLTLISGPGSAVDVGWYWQARVPLPTYLSDPNIFPLTFTHPADNILGFDVMVKSAGGSTTPPNVDNARWWGLGGASRWSAAPSALGHEMDGEKVIAAVESDADGYAYLRVLVGARGKDATDTLYSDFHVAHLNNKGKVDINSSGYVYAEIDLKVTLTIASPCGVGVAEAEELK